MVNPPVSTNLLLLFPLIFQFSICELAHSQHVRSCCRTCKPQIGPHTQTVDLLWALGVEGQGDMVQIVDVTGSGLGRDGLPFAAVLVGQEG